jgi:NitT/TauT family transport system substrate-binding protein
MPRPTDRLRYALLPLLLVALSILAACASQPAAAPAGPKQATSIQLAWTHEYSSAGFYAAEKHGYFDAAGLDVRIEAGGFGENGYIDPSKQVADGSVDFGIMSAASVIKARSEGMPLVGVVAILQRSPLALISRAESGIHRPQDLVGRRVAVADGGSRQQYETMLRSQGIDPASVTVVPRTTYGIDPLVNGDVDVLVGWAINEGVQVREAGIEPSILMMSDYGIDTYDIVLFTTERMISERPELVRDFTKAVLLGYQEVIAAPDEAAKLALEYDKTLDLEQQQRRMQAVLPLLKPAGTQLGQMQPAIWRLTQDMMLKQHDLAAPIELDRAYTLSFLSDAQSS